MRVRMLVHGYVQGRSVVPGLVLEVPADVGAELARADRAVQVGAQLEHRLPPRYVTRSAPVAPRLIPAQGGIIPGSRLYPVDIERSR